MNHLDLWSVKSLPWLFNRNLLTEIKYIFIAILCAKMSRVKKALIGYKSVILNQSAAKFTSIYSNKAVFKVFSKTSFLGVFLNIFWMQNVMQIMIGTIDINKR
jgi:hypothetical protein